MMRHHKQVAYQIVLASSSNLSGIIAAAVCIAAFSGLTISCWLLAAAYFYGVLLMAFDAKLVCILMMLVSVDTGSCCQLYTRPLHLVVY
jgi:hypothetical protein